MGAINITYSNGNLNGVIQTNDGICGLVMTGVSESGGYTLGSPILVTGMDSVASAGITAANNPFAIKQLQEYYNEAGKGAQLYVMLVPNTVTVSSMADNTNANGAVKLVNYAQGAIKVLGLISDDTLVTVGTITAAINPACATAASNAKVMVAAYQAMQMPFRVVIGGTSYTGVPGNLANMAVGTSNNAAAIMVGDTDITYSNKGAAVGLLLGRIAATPVQRKPGRTLDGPRTNAYAYLGSVLINATNADPAVISGRGYITFQMYPQTVGNYFTEDVMLTVATDDYAYMVRCRVMDKARIIAYQTMQLQVDNEVPTVPGTGQIDPGFAANLSKKIQSAINRNMTAAGNISGCSCYIDPAQVIVQTNTFNIALGLSAIGYSATINMKLGFGL